MTLLPWLELPAPLSFAGLRLEPLSSVTGRLSAIDRTTAHLVGGTFGPYADPAICWPEHDGEMPSFAEPDTARVHERLRLLTVAAIGGNRYFSLDTPANAAHFEVVFQRFTPGAETFAIERRRRDGFTLSGGHTYRKTRFHRPQATFGRLRLHWEGSLLNGLATCIDAGDSLSRRVRQSSVAFMAANRLDDDSSFEAEVVWAATALEQLLRVKKGPYFSSLVLDTLPSSHTTSAGRRMLHCWAKELYAKRSELHGAPARSETWSHGWHAMLATVAYGLCVKRLLTDAGRYHWSGDDEVEAMAFPWRVAWLRESRLPSESDAGAAWRRAGEKAMWRQARLRAMAMLGEGR